MPSLFSNLASAHSSGTHGTPEHHLEQQQQQQPLRYKVIQTKYIIFKTKLKQNQRNKTHLHTYIHNWNLYIIIKTKKER